MGGSGGKVTIQLCFIPNPRQFDRPGLRKKLQQNMPAVPDACPLGQERDKMLRFADAP